MRTDSRPGVTIRQWPLPELPVRLVQVSPAVRSRSVGIRSVERGYPFTASGSVGRKLDAFNQDKSVVETRCESRLR